MGIFSKNTCLVCGKPIKMFATTADLSEGTICETCINREFTETFMDTHADTFFKMEKLPEYRKYRTANQQILKKFDESEVFFDYFRIDDHDKFLIMSSNEVDRAIVRTHPADTRLDAIPLNEIIYMDYLYNYIDLERNPFQDYLICEIYVLLISKSTWYPYICYRPIVKKAKLQVKVNEEEYREAMENDDDLDDHIFRIQESGELLRFRQYIETNMSQKYKEFQRFLKDPDVEKMTPEYENTAKYFFKRIHSTKKLGQFDKGFYKRFLDKAIANVKLREEIADQYW